MKENNPLVEEAGRIVSEYARDEKRGSVGRESDEVCLFGAEELEKKVQDIKISDRRLDKSFVSVHLMELGDLYMEVGDLDKAEKCYMEALSCGEGFPLTDETAGMFANSDMAEAAAILFEKINWVKMERREREAIATMEKLQRLIRRLWMKCIERREKV